MAENMKKTQETSQKVQTKYDRKMAERKQREIEKQKEEKKFKLVSSCVIAVVALAILAAIIAPIVIKNKNMNSTYVVIGDREVTKLEYDYYYKASVNSFLASYASFLPYLGLDTNVSYDEQIFDEATGLTWKDEFDRMAVLNMQQIFALSKEAKEKGFTYDSSEEFATHKTNLENAAKEMNMSLAEYYKDSFGENATIANMEEIILEGIYANAYKNQLNSNYVPTTEEIDAYYAENKANFDSVDYRSFVFTTPSNAESTEEEIAAAMDELKAKADDFAAKRSEGADFNELCAANASESAKANYEDKEKDHSLSTAKTAAEVPSDLTEWLFDEARKAGEVAVIKSNSYNQYYVAEFLSRYKAESVYDTIKNTISNNKAAEYVTQISQELEIKDVNNNFKYLTKTAEAE
ncbi:MAG: hypothetical protein IKY23_05800 [Lachnospiraceae bacterium]|nr:hypothetical protein [Lachnospiraceae bacterium]